MTLFIPLRVICSYFIFLMIIPALLAPVCFPEKQNTIPLTRAHSHNDYYQKRPLLDALEHGFCSVEADVYYVNGDLLVAHDREECKPELNLKDLYLTPLFAQVSKNNLSVYPVPSEFWLLIDIKNDPERVYHTLKKLLEPYRNNLTRVEAGKKIMGAVTVVISGSVPVNTISKEKDRLVFLDGRIGDLEKNSPSDLVVWISYPWLSLFTWLGVGEIPTEELAKLRNIVSTAHKQGKKVRFWATPQTEEFWEVIYNEGVDLINTDSLDKLSAFLKSKMNK